MCIGATHGVGMKFSRASPQQHGSSGGGMLPLHNLALAQRCGAAREPASGSAQPCRCCRRFRTAGAAALLSCGGGAPCGHRPMRSASRPPGPAA